MEPIDAKSACGRELSTREDSCDAASLPSELPCREGVSMSYKPFTLEL
jgi:hypothetical protein